MTKVQLQLINDTRNEINGLAITLEYSIKLLEDYRNDLRIETKDITKEISKAKIKLKKLQEKVKGIDNVRKKTNSKKP
jgi:hypothetical protein